MADSVEDCCNITTKDKIQRMKSMAALLPDGFKIEHFDNCIYIGDLITNMLAALELVKSQLEKGYITTTNDVEGAVYDAIKRAKGES